MQNTILYYYAEHPCARIIKLRSMEISVRVDYYKNRHEELINAFSKLHFDVNRIKLKLYERLFNNVYSEYDDDVKVRKWHCYYSKWHWILTQ